MAFCFGLSNLGSSFSSKSVFARLQKNTGADGQTSFMAENGIGENILDLAIDNGDPVVTENAASLKNPIEDQKYEFKISSSIANIGRTMRLNQAPNGAITFLDLFQTTLIGGDSCRYCVSACPSNQ